MALQTIATGNLIDGRSITELSNGWLVAVLDNGDGYVAENYNGSWSLLFTTPGYVPVGSKASYALESNGTTVHVFRERIVYSFDATTHVRGSQLSNGFDFFGDVGTDMGTHSDANLEKVMYSSGDELHCIGKIYIDSEFNPRYETYYRKATVSNGINWGTATNLGSFSTISNLSFTLVNNQPYLVSDYSTGNGNYILAISPSIASNFTTSVSWGNKVIYMPSERSNSDYKPDLKQDKNGDLHLVFIYLNALNFEKGDVLYMQSSDGNTWGAPVTMYDGQNALETKVTFDRYNDAYIFFRTDTNALRMKKRTDGVWGVEESVWNNAENISVTYHKEFTSTIVGYIWQDVTSSDVQFDHILVNNPPFEPTLTQKENFDARYDARLEWVFEDGDVQDNPSAYQLQLIRDSDGSLLIDTGKVGPTPPNQFIADEFYHLPANTLTNNENYSWRVKTWDIYDAEGPYSGYGTFYTNQKPTSDITFPTTGYVNETSTVSVEWVMNDPLNEEQSAYQVVLKNNGNVVFDSGKLNSINTRRYNIPYSLENYQNYTIEVRVWDEYGIASDYDTVGFAVDYVRPTVPEVNMSSNPTDASIILQVTNYDPTNGEPPVSYNDIYRREEGGTFKRIATNLFPNVTYTDYTPASGKQYEYYVRAWGDNQTFSDSEMVEESVEFRNARLSATSDPSLQFSIKYNTERSLSYSKQHSLMQFVGRKYPVSEFGEFEELDFDITFTCRNKEGLDSFLELYHRFETMLYRDYRGRRSFVTAYSVDVTDGPVGTYKVSFNPQQVDYHEEV
jgi:hypothetical protein